jgi:hypothetical protein
MRAAQQPSDWNAQAQSLSRRQLSTELEALARSVVDSGSHRARALRWLGSALTQQGRDEEALAVYAETAVLEPCAKALAGLALSLLRLDRLDEAEIKVRAALAEPTVDALTRFQAQMVLSSVLGRQRRYGEGNAALVRAVRYSLAVPEARALGSARALAGALRTPAMYALLGAVVLKERAAPRPSMGLAATGPPGRAPRSLAELNRTTFRFLHRALGQRDRGARLVAADTPGREWGGPAVGHHRPLSASAATAMSEAKPGSALAMRLRAIWALIHPGGQVVIAPPQHASLAQLVTAGAGCDGGAERAREALAVLLHEHIHATNPGPTPRIAELRATLGEPWECMVEGVTDLVAALLWKRYLQVTGAGLLLPAGAQEFVTHYRPESEMIRTLLSEVEARTGVRFSTSALRMGRWGGRRTALTLWLAETMVKDGLMRKSELDSLRLIWEAIGMRPLRTPLAERLSAVVEPLFGYARWRRSPETCSNYAAHRLEAVGRAHCAGWLAATALAGVSKRQREALSPP